MPEEKVVTTVYGPIDRRALERLQKSFQTLNVLLAVDVIDEMHDRADELRKDMLDLHRMSAAIIDDKVAFKDLKREDWIWELAGALRTELQAFADELLVTCQTLEPLETLKPADYEKAVAG